MAQQGPAWCTSRPHKSAFPPETKSQTEKLQLKMCHLTRAKARHREGWGREVVTSITSGQVAGGRQHLHHLTGHCALHQRVSSRNIRERGFQSGRVLEGSRCEQGQHVTEHTHGSQGRLDTDIAGDTNCSPGEPRGFLPRETPREYSLVCLTRHI